MRGFPDCRMRCSGRGQISKSFDLMEPSLREGLGCPDSLPDLKLISRVKNMDTAALHGVGDGILRDAIRKEIDEAYALTCSWAPGPAGVTIVTVR